MSWCPASQNAKSLEEEPTKVEKEKEVLWEGPGGDNPFFSRHPPNFIPHLVCPQSHVCPQQPSAEPKATAVGGPVFTPLITPAHVL